MELFKVKDYTREWIFQVNHTKYIIGENHDSRYRLNRTIRHYLQKEEKSIYENESETQITFEVNGKRVDTREWKVYSISDISDLDIESKLGTKSIMFDFLEAILKDVEYDEHFIELNQQLFLFNQEVMSCCDLIFNEVTLTFGLEEFTFKSLIKSLNPSLQKEEELAKDFDLTLIQKLKIYIFMIGEIAKNNPDKEYLILMNFGSIKSETIEVLSRLNLRNIRNIIFTNHFSTNIEFKDVYFLGDVNLDFGNDQELYDKLVLDYGIADDLQTLKDRLIIAFDQRNQLEMTKILLKLV